MQPVRDFVADERPSCGQSFHAALALFLAAVDHDQNSRRTAVFGHLDCGDSRKTNTWIAQFTFDDGFNFFPQGLAQALTMVFLPAPFHASPRKFKGRIFDLCFGPYLLFGMPKRPLPFAT